MRELEIIDAIEHNLPLPSLEGVDLTLGVQYEGHSASIINALVLNNRIAKLRAVVAKMPEAEAYKLFSSRHSLGID